MTEALRGTDLFGNAIGTPSSSGALAQRFIVPPFSVLDARAGEWQARKDAWLSLGIRSEIGRGENLLNMSAQVLAGYKKQLGAYQPGAGGGVLDRPEGSTGTSIFDPVLCELAYRWWCPTLGKVVDPFAGGSVRGVVAAALGLRYWGCDLRAEQVKANEEQLGRIKLSKPPTWFTGDSREMLETAPEADFVFSCPPYGDLERYSDDPRDLSTMDWRAFLEAFRLIVRAAVARLRPNRFACFVVGNYRDEEGLLRDFRGETVRAFEESGTRFYCEGILLTPVGTAAVRAGRIFEGGRKLVPAHQHVLVFCKGSWEKAAAMTATPKMAEVEL